MVRFSSSQSSVILSSHLFLGLPLGRRPCVYPCVKIFGYLSFSMRVTCPKYVKRHVCNTSLISFFIWSSFNMSTFRLLSLLVIPHIFLRTAISKFFSFRFWSSFIVHVCLQDTICRYWMCSQKLIGDSSIEINKSGPVVELCLLHVAVEPFTTHHIGRESWFLHIPLALDTSVGGVPVGVLP